MKNMPELETTKESLHYNVDLYNLASDLLKIVHLTRWKGLLVAGKVADNYAHPVVKKLCSL